MGWNSGCQAAVASLDSLSYLNVLLEAAYSCVSLVVFQQFFKAVGS